MDAFRSAVAALIRNFIDAAVSFVENLRGDDEALVESFAVDTSRAREELRWTPEWTIEATVRDAFVTAATESRPS